MPAAPSTDGGNCARKPHRRPAAARSRSDSPDAEADRGAVAVVHDRRAARDPHPCRAQAGRAPVPRASARSRSPQSPVTGRRRTSGPEAHPPARRAIASVRPRSRACAADRSACPGHSPTGRQSDGAIEHDGRHHRDDEERGDQQELAAAAPLRVVGWAQCESPDLPKLRTNQIAAASAAKANHCTA